MVEEDINLTEFRSLMRTLSSIFSSEVEWIAMPEAEIVKIKLSLAKSMQNWISRID